MKKGKKSKTLSELSNVTERLKNADLTSLSKEELEQLGETIQTANNTIAEVEKRQHSN